MARLIDIPEYRIFRGMIARCENPNKANYQLYGGIGVRVCSDWRRDFWAFFAHIGPRPSPLHSVDRIDPTKDYEPGNVRWALAAEQNNNRRNTRFVVYRGDRMPLAVAVRLAGSVINREAAATRIKSGWDVARALETPRLMESRAAKYWAARAAA